MSLMYSQKQEKPRGDFSGQGGDSDEKIKVTHYVACRCR